MKIRIREGNDFDVAWAIKRGGVPEDLSTAINMKLTLVVYGLVIEHNLFTVTDNLLSINIPKEVATVNGDYRLVFEYTLPDAGQPDGDLKCKTDVVPFRIVPFTAKADDIYIINVTSDIAIGLKGDKGDDGADAYQIWLDLGNEGTYEDFIAYLRQPAVDAGASISELEGEIQVSEGLRVEAESERVQAESERQVIIQEAVTATQEATTAASLADTARLAIQDDLAQKADHGYEANPKTLKQVDDEIIQLAGDIQQSIDEHQQSIDDMKNSVLYKMEFSLTEGGYIDGRTGGVTAPVPNFSYTADFLPVKPGQTIHYKGYNYGNATLCGYSKDKTSFVNLLTTPGSPSLVDVDIVIPDNIYYIRGCTAKVNDFYLLEINPDFNYDFLDKEIKEVIDSQSSDTINNMIQDPYFKYGIMLTAVDPQLIAHGYGGVISLSNGEAVNKSAITTAKGMQIMARFSQGWATKFGLKAGDTIRVGAYIKAVVGSGSTVTAYGTFRRNDLTDDKITYIGTNNSLPLNSYTDWQWIERTLTLKTDGTDIDQTTDFSLGYIQLTDPGAATNPTELRIKQPCILFNPPAAASGFYESKRSQQMDYLFVNFLSIMGSLSIGGDLSVNNLIFNGSQVESTFLTMTTEKAKIRWIELSGNQCFPSIGKFLGLKNDSDLIFCVNGVETKLN